MGEVTGIEWCHHTFNPWHGCTKVSAGCKFCYAEVLAKRFGGDIWGPGKARKPMKGNYWKQPLKWNKAAESEGVRHRVFCASMSDVFDQEGIPELRERLWDLIEATPNLDWLLLTKRPELVMEMVPVEWRGGFPQNVWVGTSIENQAVIERVRELIKVPARVRFLSIEPMIGPVKLGDSLQNIHWVICGGESGPHARPLHTEDIGALYEEVRVAGKAWFFKQLGSSIAKEQGLRNKKGEDLEELRVMGAKDLNAMGIDQDWIVQEFPV